MRDSYEMDDRLLELGETEEEQVDEEPDSVAEIEVRAMIDRYAEWVDIIDR